MSLFINRSFAAVRETFSFRSDRFAYLHVGRVPRSYHKESGLNHSVTSYRCARARVFVTRHFPERGSAKNGRSIMFLIARDG